MRYELLTSAAIYSTILSYLIVIIVFLADPLLFSISVKANQLYISLVLSSYFLVRYYLIGKGGLPTLLWGYSFIFLAITSFMDLLVIFGFFEYKSQVFMIRIIFTTNIPLLQFMGTAHIFTDKKQFHTIFPCIYGIIQYIISIYFLFTVGIPECALISTVFYDVPLHLIIAYLLLEYGFYRKVISAWLIGLGSLFIATFNMLWYWLVPFSLTYSLLNIGILQNGFLMIGIGLILGRYEFKKK